MYATGTGPTVTTDGLGRHSRISQATANSDARREVDSCVKLPPSSARRFTQDVEVVGPRLNHAAPLGQMFRVVGFLVAFQCASPFQYAGTESLSANSVQ